MYGIGEVCDFGHLDPTPRRSYAQRMAAKKIRREKADRRFIRKRVGAHVRGYLHELRPEDKWERHEFPDKLKALNPTPPGCECAYAKDRPKLDGRLFTRELEHLIDEIRDEQRR